MTHVAEYLGQRTDVAEPTIVPAASDAMCPFMNSSCSKIAQGFKPVCSVRKKDGTLWLSCRNRLCSSKKTPVGATQKVKKQIPLSDYQKKILLEIAQTIFSSEVTFSDIAIKREVKIPIVENQSYSADYVMRWKNPLPNYQGPDSVILEMQGGGETTNTGKLTRHIQEWENSSEFTNKMLATDIKAVGTLETNAWRRQQEQFIIKGNIAIRSNGGMVIAIGTLLFDYLNTRLSASVASSELKKTHTDNWNLALVTFAENKNHTGAGPIPLEVDPARVLFTDYLSFVEILITQGAGLETLFNSNFEDLENGNPLVLPSKSIKSE